MQAKRLKMSCDVCQDLGSGEFWHWIGELARANSATHGSKSVAKTREKEQKSALVTACTDLRTWWHAEIEMAWNSRPSSLAPGGACTQTPLYRGDCQFWIWVLPVMEMTSTTASTLNFHLDENKKSAVFGIRSPGNKQSQCSQCMVFSNKASNAERLTGWPVLGTQYSALHHFFHLSNLMGFVLPP